MLLDIDTDVFDSSDHSAVIRLLDLIASERHDWRPGLPAADAAERFLVDTMPKTPALLDLVRKCLVEGANPAPSAGTQVRVNAAEVRQLAQELQQPAVLVVEDAFTEECFLLAVARAFGRTRILLAQANNWVEFAHAGGVGRIARFVARHRAHYALLGPLRVAGLLDSDRQVPHQRTRSHDIADEIAAQGCAVHVWKHRHVESYVPSVVWRHHFPDRAAKIGMLLDMRPDQRGCLDMKKGLGFDDAWSPEVADHYRDLPAEIRRNWSIGLKLSGGRRLVPDELPLSEADFAELGEAAVAELRQVLAMIERIL